jgi:hypothetical protein
MVKKPDEIPENIANCLSKIIQSNCSNSAKVLYLALLNKSGFRYGISFNTSRKELMKASSISSFSTYHKAIKQLCENNFITYKPSFVVYDKSSFQILG